MTGRKRADGPDAGVGTMPVPITPGGVPTDDIFAADQKASDLDRKSVV